ncbi:MAG: Cof-type HAD-IIB family hydrolase [Candidatus Omnitrophica bacterium]|nr:Cof-type HAD-IIB family hydrolase [Candidatus Omnitrophota bacterium]
MDIPIKIISTDFDGTVHTEGEYPPVPRLLQDLIGTLQDRGAKWVINTGRTLAELLEILDRARLHVHPDYLVVVEHEIHALNQLGYVQWPDWNQRCRLDQKKLFARILPALPPFFDWIKAHYSATVYSDAYSPFCLVAKDNADTDAILLRLKSIFQDVPELAVMRNDVYARLSHAAYNKGTALAEIARRLGVGPEQVFAAGDHWNDLPMLSAHYARWLVAPANAVPEVKAAVRRQQGFVSAHPCGYGVAHGLAFCLAQAKSPRTPKTTGSNHKPK